LSFERYGLEFADGVNELSVELFCYLAGRTQEQGGVGRATHMMNAITILWPEQMADGRPGFVPSEWTYRRINSWCRHKEKTSTGCLKGWETWWGPSSAGKSTDAGVIALVDWLAAPDRTTTTVCSTTREMLRDRIWAEMIKYYLMLEGALPGHYVQSKMRITYGQDNSKNCIRGIAIKQGAIKDAVANVIGIHNERNRLIIDEMQGTPTAAVEAADNLSTGKEFTFLGMGNPVSRLDPLGQYSEPLGGWDTISSSFDEWQTKNGWCTYFDGLKSPAIANPKKYFFLLNKDDIDALATQVGRDSPRFWTQRRGFVPPEGLAETVMTEAYVQKFQICREPIWESDYVTVAGCDPSYSSGGDNCILYPADVGKLLRGPVGICFREPIPIQFEISSGEPMTYFLMEKISEHCKKLGIPPRMLAIDITSAQRMLADVLEKEWGPGIFRVEFGGSASDLPASSEDPRPGKDVYKNKVTELWYTMSIYARSNQVRGLSVKAAQQFCGRLLVTKDVRHICIETKKEYKKRTSSESPDEADAAVCVVALVREKLGYHPGGMLVQGSEAEARSDRELDVDSDDEVYLTSEFDDDVSAEWLQFGF